MNLNSLRNAEMHNAKDVQQTSRAHQREKHNECDCCPLFQLIVTENFEFSIQYCMGGEEGCFGTPNWYYVKNGQPLIDVLKLKSLNELSQKQKQWND